MGCNFFCFNCKIQKPEFGNNCCERIATIISVILFLLFIIEIVAYNQFIDVYESAEGVSCCGAIDESSSTFPGAVCYEDDFPEEKPIIPRVEINGSYFCTVNEQICDQWTIALTNLTVFYDPSDPNRTTLPTTFENCLASSGYSTNSICNEEVLEQATADSISSAITWCWIAIWFGILTTSVCLCDFVGCFRDSAFCENKCSSLCTKSCEVFFWLMVVVMSITVIENPAGNGYVVNNVYGNVAFDYLERNCNTDTFDQEDVEDDYIPIMKVIWTELELDVPAWLNSSFYNSIGIIGICASLFEFSVYFYMQCCAKKKSKEENGDGTSENRDQMTTSIEMHTAQ